MFTPLLTLIQHDALLSARAQGLTSIDCTLDLDRSRTTVSIGASHWSWQGNDYPYLERCKDRTIYYWTGEDFAPVQRYGNALIKLIPTPWGAPTFEIDGIKMLPTAQVDLIAPPGKRVLDTCGGLGYFADCCLKAGAREVHSFEKNADVLWLRGINPWSPRVGDGLDLRHADISLALPQLADGAFDAVLHDPPRFGIAGELYSEDFYRQLARVLRPGGGLFHYTGSPNKLTSGRDVPKEVSLRLRRVGFTVTPNGDGLLAIRR